MNVSISWTVVIILHAVLLLFTFAGGSEETKKCDGHDIVCNEHSPFAGLAEYLDPKYKIGFEEVIKAPFVAIGVVLKLLAFQYPLLTGDNAILGSFSWLVMVGGIIIMLAGLVSVGQSFLSRP